MKVLTTGSLVDLDGADYRLLWTIRAAARRQLDQDPGYAAGGEGRAGHLGGGVRRRALPDPDRARGRSRRHLAGRRGRARPRPRRRNFRAGARDALLRGRRRFTAARAARRSALARRAVLVAPARPRHRPQQSPPGVHLLEQQQEDSGVDAQTFEAMKTARRGRPKTGGCSSTCSTARPSRQRKPGSVGALHLAAGTRRSRSPRSTRRHATSVRACWATWGHAYYYAGDRATLHRVQPARAGGCDEAGHWVTRAPSHT